MNFKTTDRALLRLIRQSLFANGALSSLALQEEEWKSLVSTADALGVLPTAFNGAFALSPSALPKHLPEAWSELAYRQTERSEHILGEEARLLTALHDSHIPVLFFGDTAAAAYYPNPALRAVRTADCLCECKIKEITDSLELSLPFTVRQTLTVNQEEGIEAVRLRSLLARALDARTELPLGEQSLPVPNFTVQALLILLASEQKPSLLHLLDWTVLLQYGLSERDTQLPMQLRSWQQCGLLDTAKQLSLAASIAFDLELDDWFADADKEEAEQLLTQMLTPDSAKLERAEKRLELAMQRAARPPKAASVQKKKKSSSEKNAFSRLFGGIFKKNQ